MKGKEQDIQCARVQREESSVMQKRGDNRSHMDWGAPLLLWTEPPWELSRSLWSVQSLAEESSLALQPPQNPHDSGCSAERGALYGDLDPQSLAS